MMRFKSRTVIGMLLGCALACSSQPAEAQGMRLYVASSRGDDISIIDLSSFKVIGDINVGERVHGVAVQADGRRLFTTVESDQTLKIVDTSTDKILGTIKLGGRPNQCAVTPDGKYVAVPIRDGDSVDIIDVRQQKIVKILPIKEPHNALDADSNRYMFVSSMGSHEINVIDLETMEYSSRIPVGGRPRPYVLSADGNTMYVAVSDLHGFVIVDVPGKRVIERVEMPAEHSGPLRLLKYETPDTRTHGLALAPDGSELWVTSLIDDCMYIYDVKARKITGRVATGKGPNWVVFSPEGKYVCISNTDTDDVSIIDAKARREVARVKVGKVPKRLVVANVPVPPPDRESAKR